MGILDGQSQASYYQGSDHGGYQFTSLKDIINQLSLFQGEQLLSKISLTVFMEVVIIRDLSDNKY